MRLASILVFDFGFLSPPITNPDSLSLLHDSIPPITHTHSPLATSLALILHSRYSSLSFSTPSIPHSHSTLPHTSLILHSPIPHSDSPLPTPLCFTLTLRSPYPSLSFFIPPFLTIFPTPLSPTLVLHSAIPHSHSSLPYPSFPFSTSRSLALIIHPPPLLPNLSSRSPPSQSPSSQTFHSDKRKHVLLTLLRRVNLE